MVNPVSLFYLVLYYIAIPLVLAAVMILRWDGMARNSKVPSCSRCSLLCLGRIWPFDAHVFPGRLG